MNLISLPTVEHNSSGQHFFAYVDPASVIGITPQLKSNRSTWYEDGAVLHLNTGATITTSWLSANVAAVLAAAAKES